MKKVFVTVGTTKFPKLVDAITQLPTLQALKHCGYGEVQIQTGLQFEGPKIDPKLKATVQQQDSGWTVRLDSLVLRYGEYFEDFGGQIARADLVISHAGAGSCLEVLKLGKPLIVVVNEELMDNHQLELANQLQDDGFLYFCTCDNLSSTLCKDLSGLKPYPKPDQGLFGAYLDKCCGFPV